MGVFGWFRRGQAAESTEAAATATVVDRPQPQQEALGAGPAPDADDLAADQQPRGTSQGAADPVGIPKQQSADGAADSESGEGARA